MDNFLVTNCLINNYTNEIFTKVTYCLNDDVPTTVCFHLCSYLSFFVEILTDIWQNLLIIVIVLIIIYGIIVNFAFKKPPVVIQFLEENGLIALIVSTALLAIIIELHPLFYAYKLFFYIDWPLNFAIFSILILIFLVIYSYKSKNVLNFRRSFLSQMWVLTFLRRLTNLSLYLELFFIHVRN
jgi:hypothetical protein